MGLRMDKTGSFVIPDLQEVALLLDIDGTIVDIAPTPAAARVTPGLKAALTRLVGLTGGALALVSGRSLADIDRLFTPMRLAAIGGHGAEFRPGHGDDAVARDPLGLEPEFRRRLRELGDGRVVAEDKGYSVALHYRLAPERAAHVLAAVNQICAEAPHTPIEILPGKAVIEVKHAGFSKATGVRELMSHAPFAGRRPVFVGDDVTDETVFAILPELDGIGFSVGRKVVGTAGCFEAPAGVRAWLEQLAATDESLAS
jgi:trehalose 6-phosphate phosphatase